MLYLLVALIVLLVGSYFLFRDTMNRLQYVATFRIYWVTRNDGRSGSPVVCRARMYHTAPPWWRGRGVQFRAGTYTFQVGVLTGKGASLLDQLGGRDLEVETSKIRNWGRKRENETV